VGVIEEIYFTASRGRGRGTNEDSICGSVISVPSVAKGFWLRLLCAVTSVAKIRLFTRPSNLMDWHAHAGFVMWKSEEEKGR